MQTLVQLAFQTGCDGLAVQLCLRQQGPQQPVEMLRIAGKISRMSFQYSGQCAVRWLDSYSIGNAYQAFGR